MSLTSARNSERESPSDQTSDRVQSSSQIRSSLSKRQVATAFFLRRTNRRLWRRWRTLLPPMRWMCACKAGTECCPRVGHHHRAAGADPPGPGQQHELGRHGENLGAAPPTAQQVPILPGRGSSSACSAATARTSGSTSAALGHHRVARGPGARAAAPREPELEQHVQPPRRGPRAAPCTVQQVPILPTSS